MDNGIRTFGELMAMWNQAADVEDASPSKKAAKGKLRSVKKLTVLAPPTDGDDTEATPTSRSDDTPIQLRVFNGDNEA